MRADKVKVGTIRWDAWIGDRGYQGLEVERSLSPKHYHYRVPYFGKILSDNEVIIRYGDDQKIIDNDIRFLKASGVDYFAFLWYGGKFDPEMEACRKAYLASMEKSAIKWCHILGGGWCSTVEEGGDEAEKLLEETVFDMDQDIYQKTDDGKPIVYFFDIRPECSIALTLLRKKLFEKCGRKLYVIGMTFFPEHAGEWGIQLGIDAWSRYSTGDKFGAPYAQLRALEQDKWKEFEYTGKDIVPSVSAGWDKRPRAENPVLWEKDVAPELWDWHVQTAKPEELAAHLKDGISYACKHGNESFSSVIIYAWNEHDEGGYICPTVVDKQNGGEPAYLSAISRSLADIRAPELAERAPNSARLVSCGVYERGTDPGKAVESAEKMKKILSRAFGLPVPKGNGIAASGEGAAVCFARMFAKAGNSAFCRKAEQIFSALPQGMSYEQFAEAILSVLFLYDVE